MRRDTGEKESTSLDSVGEDVSILLDDIHAYLYAQAHRNLETHKVQVSSWKEFTSNLDKGNLMLAPFCGQKECEEAIKKDSARDKAKEPGTLSMGAKSLCIPFE